MLFSSDFERNKDLAALANLTVSRDGDRSDFDLFLFCMMKEEKKSSR